MTKLEKSVREQMHFYMAELKAGLYWVHEQAGQVPDGHMGYIKAAYADYADGICTDITIYTEGDAYKRSHFYNEDGTIDITDAICGWLTDGAPYSALIDAVCEAIKTTPADTSNTYTGEMIPLTDYAALHGRDPATVRQKAIRGGFQTAVKFGRDWLIREDEPYGDLRRASARKERD